MQGEGRREKKDRVLWAPSGGGEGIDFLRDPRREAAKIAGPKRGGKKER